MRLRPTKKWVESAGICALNDYAVFRRMKKTFDSIESVVADIRRGKMVIVVDDDDRENEGDLIMAGQHVTPAAVNFMARHGRGLICVPTTAERLQQLGIDRMVHQNRESFRTDFQVSVDAARGITTGISAADRAKTIHIMAVTHRRAGGFGPARPRFSVARAARRRVAARRPHRSGGGPRANSPGCVPSACSAKS